MTRRPLFAIATIILTGAVCVAALDQPSPAPPQPKRGEKPPAAASSQVSRGERVFQQNCSRCHNAPQGFPQQVSGTVLRHMRVRASLSAADEKALLEFMNP